MRQVILVILLVGAAFLGGAFVNGPGLQWAQARVLRLLGLNSVGEIAAVDLEASSNGETDADSTPIERLENPCTLHRYPQSHRKTNPSKKIRPTRLQHSSSGPSQSKVIWAQINPVRHFYLRQHRLAR